MPAYTSFVLRVWRVRHDSRWVCRAMLERVSTGERRGFPDLLSLIAFLEAEAEAATEAQAEASHDATDHTISHRDDELTLKGWL